MTFERFYTNAAGKTVKVRVDILEDDRLEKAIRSLVQKALLSKTLKYATALGGAFRVSILEGKTEAGFPLVGLK